MGTDVKYEIARMHELRIETTHRSSGVATTIIEAKRTDDAFQCWPGDAPGFVPRAEPRVAQSIPPIHCGSPVRPGGLVVSSGSAQIPSLTKALPGPGSDVRIARGTESSGPAAMKSA